MKNDFLKFQIEHYSELLKNAKTKAAKDFAKNELTCLKRRAKNRNQKLVGEVNFIGNFFSQTIKYEK